MKIVIAEKISAAAAEQLKEPGWTVLTADQLEGKLAEHLESADALMVRSAVQVDAALLANAKKLRVIGRAGVGVDNIDLDAATRQGIAVMNTPGANAVAVAEHTLGMMLAMARHLCRADALMHAGKWEKKSLQGTELRGKTLGIVGLGRIGMEVARRARAFGMKIVAHDPFVSAGVAKEQGIQLASLDDLYAAADYITLHVGLTPQTTGMINEAAIKKMKKGVRLVNCARGELVDEADLVAALKARTRGAAALDVFSEEPLKNSPLQALENVILTPHIGGSDNEGAGSSRRADRTAGARIPEARRDSECRECAFGLRRRICGDAALHCAGGTHGSVSGADFRGSIQEISIALQRPHRGVEDRFDPQWRDQGDSEPDAG